MNLLLTDEEITDWLYNSLKEIEAEEGVKLSDRAFIADFLTPRIKVRFKAQLKKVMEWGNEDCPHPSTFDGQRLTKKKNCPECWKDLLDEVK